MSSSTEQQGAAVCSCLWVVVTWHTGLPMLGAMRFSYKAGRATVMGVKMQAVALNSPPAGFSAVVMPCHVMPRHAVT